MFRTSFPGAKSISSRVTPIISGTLAWRGVVKEEEEEEEEEEREEKGRR
jgi:hypothetical protein